MWVSLTAVERGHDHIKCFSGTCKMNLEVTGALTVLQRLVHEAFQVLAYHGVLVPLKESVRIQFYKLPFGAAFHIYVGTAPTIEALHGQWIILRKRAVIQTWNRKTAQTPGPIKNKRSGKNDR